MILRASAVHHPPFLSWSFRSSWIDWLVESTIHSWLLHHYNIHLLQFLNLDLKRSHPSCLFITIPSWHLTPKPSSLADQFIIVLITRHPLHTHSFNNLSSNLRIFKTRHQDHLTLPPSHLVSSLIHYGHRQAFPITSPGRFPSSQSATFIYESVRLGKPSNAALSPVPIPTYSTFLLPSRPSRSAQQWSRPLYHLFS